MIKFCGQCGHFIEGEEYCGRHYGMKGTCWLSGREVYEKTLSCASGYEKENEE